MKSGLLLTLVFTSFVYSANAQAASPNANSNNIDPDKLKGLCNELAEKNPVEGENPYRYRYEYERMIYEAAGSNRDEDAAVARLKIQRLWKDYISGWECRNTTTSSLEADVLKYAVAMEAFHFLTLASNKWRVDLNIRNPSDSRTILDFIEDEKVKAQGKPFWDTLDRYYKMLAAAGAKRRDELDHRR